MATLQDLVVELNYSSSPNFRTEVGMFEPETAHIFRDLSDLGVRGIYVFQSTSTEEIKVNSENPFVYIAEAESIEQARSIHKSVWNVGKAPFLIIVLPQEIRVYTGFDFGQDKRPERGLLDIVPLNGNIKLVREALEAFAAYSLDSGRVWSYEKYTTALDPKQKVDVRLLANLQDLDKALIELGHLSPSISHALIGKYVYIRYLWDRGILTEEWLIEQGVRRELVFGRAATARELAKLASVLENRFNGRVFPIDFSEEGAPTDDHVSLTASVFMGDEFVLGNSHLIQQLHLEFQAYDFRYIPVETLSAVYEQFIDDRKLKGAIYTPEVLADYILAEVHSVSGLTEHTKVLDPACGSGVFLVLIYRRLIERELAQQNKKRLPPEKLKDLLRNIYGIERELDACYVTEFSLILTLLHYIEPRELHLNTDFRFPNLHNSQVFHGDFFDPNLLIWQLKVVFDWVVGNPPWVKASTDQPFAAAWISANTGSKPVGNLSVAEAFSWRAIDVLSATGVVGLVMPATSLVNIISESYRKKFFGVFRVYRITNFANLREVLFEKRAALPAATFVYRPQSELFENYEIIHVAPMLINQVPGNEEKPWLLTVYENEVQHISSFEAAKGDTATWKLALWGTHLDKNVIERIRRLFPKSLESSCIAWGWGRKYPQQGAELRINEDGNEEVEFYEPLSEMEMFSTERFNQKPRHRFSLPARALVRNTKHFIRKRGGRAGLRINYAPHIILSKGWDFVIYSDEDFVIPPQQMGISAPNGDGNKLRALACYLSSSLARYYLFFQVPEWGVFRQRESVVVSEVRKIPTPDFSTQQVTDLSDLFLSISEQEAALLENFSNNPADIQSSLQRQIDEGVYRILQIPSEISFVINDFVNIRLPLDSLSQSRGIVNRKPTEAELVSYATEIRDELSAFTLGVASYRVDVLLHGDLIECIVNVEEGDTDHSVTQSNIRKSNAVESELYKELWEAAGYHFSQWAYVQRGLRLFEGSRIHIYKPARIINWMRTQAILDANIVIGQSLSSRVVD